jgi:3-oxocholest-4-en-26-oate---CoA ligase
MQFNLADLWETVADTVPDNEAVVYAERRYTYREVEARVNRLAHHLQQHGIGAGDKVALLLYNCPEYLEGMLAAFKLGAVPINVNYRYVEDELRYLLANSDSKAVIFGRAFALKLAAIHNALPGLDHYMTVEDGGDATPDSLAAIGAVDYEVALADASPDRDFGARSADDIYMLYTGGTTGMPKGVMWRHEDIFFAAFGGGGIGNEIKQPGEIAQRARDGRTRCLPAPPFMHGTAHWMAFMTLYTGGCVVISEQHHFDPVKLWQLVAHEHVNFLVIVGDAFARPLVETIAQLPSDTNISGCSVVLSGGAVLSGAVKHRLAETLPGSLIIDGYGSSEAGAQGQQITTSGADAVEGAPFSVNDQTTVLDDEMRPAGVGVVGMLARRGHIPLGYYKDPEKTAATFPVVDGVRWSVPGDHARIEADGAITLLGRGSVSISTGGEKVYPEEVESILKSHRAVFDAVVVGVPDERWGERVVALVEIRPGMRADFDDIDAHLRTHLAAYKVPREVITVAGIVRSPSGKPDYRWATATALDRLGLTASR